MELQDSYDYNKQLSASLLEFNAPLEEAFKFRLFTYRRFNKDGHFVHLTTDTNWMDHCYKNELFVSSDIKNKLSATLGGNQKILWSGFRQDPLYDALYQFDIWNGITFYEQHPNFVEVFAFSSTRSETQTPNFYINNFHLLDYVKGLFRDRFHDPLSDKFVPAFSLAENQQPKTGGCDEQAHEVHRQFLLHNSMSKFYFPPPYAHVYVTLREGVVLYHISRKKTAKEVARVLGISYRTVESHLNAIKLRFNGMSLSDITEMFINGDIHNQIEYTIRVDSGVLK